MLVWVRRQESRSVWQFVCSKPREFSVLFPSQEFRFKIALGNPNAGTTAARQGTAADNVMTRATS